MDWSDGSYELTATTLEPATGVVLDSLGIGPSTKLLDLGCGTGNAALEAARRGARVTAVDPAARLLEVTRQRAAAEGLTIETALAGAAALPFEDAAFDAVVSVFAMIFAPDAVAAATETVRVLRPGGRLVLSSWLPTGGLFEAGLVLRGAMAQLMPEDPARSSPRWGDPGYVRELFAPLGCYVEYTEHELMFEAESAGAWFDEQERHHPMWRAVRGALGSDTTTWERVRAESVTILQRASTDPTKLRLPSGYMVYSVARP